MDSASPARKTTAAWLLSVVITGAFYFWIIGIGAVPQRFAWNSGLDEFYNLHDGAVIRGSRDVNGYYDLLGRAFARGQLQLPVKPSAELLSLANPWDNNVNGPYKLLDTVLYHQRFYLYHGPAPALLLFAPWYWLTGHDLPENFAVFMAALGGYLFLSLLFLQICSSASWNLPVPLLLLYLFAIGIAQPAGFVLHRAKVYEVAITCGYCCVSAGFYFLFRWLVSPRWRPLWPALSGVSFGLAIGCRPHLGLAAASAFVLVLVVRRLSRQALLAFTVPVILCCAALATYNYARFDNPLEFGLSWQMADAPYQDVHLSAVNVKYGVYYLLFARPVFVPEFPFVRLPLRQPFDAPVRLLPERYFLEPTAGTLGLCPLILAAFLMPPIRQRFDSAPVAFPVLVTMLAFAAGCLLFISATALTSERFKLDFEPFLVFVGCAAACAALQQASSVVRALATSAVIVLLLYSIAANTALALQGPYDQFVQVNPHTYARMARWFSPVERYRPVENPELHVEAAFEFQATCGPGWESLISAGEFGSRYLLWAECLAPNRLRLHSDTALLSPEVRVAEAEYATGMNIADIRFNPRDRVMTVSWNRKVVIRHPLRFLITSPSQIHLGWDPSLGNTTIRFPRRIVPLDSEWKP